MVEIVKLPASAWQEYKAIRLESLLQDPQAFGSSFAKTSLIPDDVWQTRLAHAGTAGNSWLWFARADGRLVGLIGGYPNEDGITAELNSFYVAPGSRGQGLGRQLLKALLGELSTLGLTTVRLSVNREQSAAVGLYRAFGFIETGTYSATLGDGKVHEELTLERPLPLL